MYVDISCSDNAAIAPVRMQRAQGRARVALRERAGRTRVETLFQEGCAKVRLPRHLPDRRTEAILINTAGGLTGGDDIAIDVSIGRNAAATITTQACERIYRSTGADATVASRLSVSEGGKLAWLPQETIMFDGGRLRRQLSADLAADAELLVVEAIIFGRAAMGEVVGQGAFHDRWRIRRSGKFVFADDLRVEGDISGQLARPAVLGGASAMATVLFVASEPERLLDPVRAAIGQQGGASAWGGKLVARLCAHGGLALRRALEPVLTVLMGGSPLPKVWQL